MSLAPSSLRSFRSRTGQCETPLFADVRGSLGVVVKTRVTPIWLGRSGNGNQLTLTPAIPTERGTGSKLAESHGSRLGSLSLENTKHGTPP